MTLDTTTPQRGAQAEFWPTGDQKTASRTLYTRDRRDGTRLRVSLDRYLWIRSGQFAVRIEHGEIARLRQALEGAEEDLSCLS